MVASDACLQFLRLEETTYSFFEMLADNDNEYDDVISTNRKEGSPTSPEGGPQGGEGDTYKSKMLISRCIVERN